MHSRIGPEPDWVDFSWFMVRCECGWYARRPTKQKAKREYFWHREWAKRECHDRVPSSAE